MASRSSLGTKTPKQNKAANHQMGRLTIPTPSQLQLGRASINPCTTLAKVNVTPPSFSIKFRKKGHQSIKTLTFSAFCIYAGRQMILQPMTGNNTLYKSLFNVNPDHSLCSPVCVLYSPTMCISIELLKSKLPYTCQRAISHS